MRQACISFGLSLLIIGVLTLSCGCTRRHAEPAVSPVPATLKLAVVPFTQPRSTHDLILGQLPENQGYIPSDTLRMLDAQLRQALRDVKRTCIWLQAQAPAKTGEFHESGTPQGLAMWCDYARQHQLDVLLVPQILNWHQRQGSAAGVTESAHIRAEFYLIDPQQGRVLRRSIFEEKQQGLAENFLRAGDFFKRKGRWVTAEELGQEAIDKAIKELGL